LLSQVIDRQVSCDGEQPRLETEAAVILPRVFQNTQPGFLNEVLRQFTPGCPVDQISEKPIVILRDDSANEFGVSSPQCARDALRLGFRHTRKGSHHGNHTPIYEVWRRNYAWPRILEDAQRLSSVPYRGVVVVEEVPWGRRLPPARPLAHSWYQGILMTTMRCLPRTSSSSLRRLERWLCSRFCHQWRTTSSGTSTAMWRFSWMRSSERM